MVGPLLRSLFSSTSRKSCSNYLQSHGFSRALGFTRPFSQPAAAASVASSSHETAGTGVLDPSRLRNAAVIAHVDHGKTTLMDRLLRQCGADVPHERALDSITLERERGITIASKVTSISWKENELNMVDTPGHADFGGEVERVVGMVEGAVLVVDAGEGPLAQTKFVLAKALRYGLRPILLLNKVDRPSVTEERCNEVESLVFDLFANLGATEAQLEFPVLYASAKEGWASSTYTKCPTDDAKNMSDLLDAIIRHVPPPSASLDAPFQMLVSMMERDNYVGRILTGRISSGILHVGDKVHGLHKTDSGIVKIEEGKVVKLMKKKGTSIISIDRAGAGDIVSMAGLACPAIGHTIANVEVMTALPNVELDPPTISMNFGVNDSPLAGREGTYDREEHDMQKERLLPGRKPRVRAGSPPDPLGDHAINMKSTKRDLHEKAIAGLRRINLDGLIWRVFDAKGQVLGRLASHISTVVQGKDKPTYVPNRDEGDMCIVLNAKDVCVTGRKMTDKLYRWHTGYIGHLKERSLKDQMARDPTEVIRKAILRMLPRNKLRDDRDRKLRIFAGSEHPFGDRPLEHHAMPPRQVREMRPRAKRAMVRAQKKAEQQEQDETTTKKGKKRDKVGSILEI